MAREQPEPARPNSAAASATNAMHALCRHAAGYSLRLLRCIRPHPIESAVRLCARCRLKRQNPGPQTEFIGAKVIYSTF